MSRLLTQNSELRPHGIWNWTIPAWYVRLDDGRLIHTCPSAGICARLCYARNGTYLFRNVIAKHTANLRLVLDDTDRWRQLISAEIAALRPRPRTTPGITADDLRDDPFLHRWLTAHGPAVRIHDAGDFFADWYLREWINLAVAHPEVLFYAYTKEVRMMRAVAAYPDNFRYLLSTGGIYDHEIGDERHADVFPDEVAIRAAGYESQDASDLLAVLLRTNRVGIPANNIRHFNKRMAGRTFAEMQVAVRR
jgi:hypothetical protein